MATRRLGLCACGAGSRADRRGSCVRLHRYALGHARRRACVTTYAQVTANSARNNIQESLKDLGANTPYGTRRSNGSLIPNVIDPQIEDEFQPPPPEPGCRPLEGWDFKLGDRLPTLRPTSASWGSLSSVTNPYSTDDHHVRTQYPAVQPVARSPVATARSCAGATTIELTEEQRKQANGGQSLWVQGGVPGDPDQRRSQLVRVRCAALRDRQCQWRQRRVHHLSRGRGQPRVLLTRTT